MNMEPSNNSFQGLIGNGVKYVIPKFQRDYSWGQEQWEELWEDIENLADENYHYMGYIVLQRKEDSLFEVIDGQQRLVTLSIIVLAGLRLIQKLIDGHVEVENNKSRIELIRENYIGFKDPVNLMIKSKLTLNRNNGRYFKEICNKLDSPNHRQIIQTNKLIRDAFEFFKKKSFGDSGEEIAQKITNIAKGMIFTKIVVTDDVNAYKVFETLNARGVQLSTPDLLKNYIFSIIAKNDDVADETLADLDDEWSQVLNNLGEAHFTDFVRYHHNFQYKLITKKKLFSEIKNLITTPQEAIEYLHSLSKYSSVYSALLNFQSDWWNLQEDKYREVKQYLEGLNLFKIKQPNTVLMAAFEKFSADEFVQLLKYIYMLSIRYNVICHLSPNEQEQKYNKIAIKVFNGVYKRASHVKNDPELFGEIYPADSEFKNSFEFYRMPSRQSAKKIRYLLAQIETRLGNNINYISTTLEHVCPYYPEQDWQEKFGEGVVDVYDRLGNMVLLEKDELKRVDFETKKNHYRNTSFKLAKKVSEYDVWNLESVNQFQLWLAEQAVQTWRVD